MGGGGVASVDIVRIKKRCDGHPDNYVDRGESKLWKYLIPDVFRPVECEGSYQGEANCIPTASKAFCFTTKYTFLC